MESTLLESLQNRPPLGKLRERDIDLLLCCELHYPGALRAMFARSWGEDNIEFVGAWVSYYEHDGETDLVAKFKRGKKFLLLLLENKIDAPFADSQAERYASRAISWKNRDDEMDVRTVLLAPSDYLKQPETAFFDELIPYEDLIDVLKGTADGRSVFLSAALKQGIDKKRQGYTPTPDQAVTEMWHTIYRRSRSVAPCLNMKNPRDKPGKSAYIYFRQAKGFQRIGSEKKGVVIKGDRGYVDLQFSATTVSYLESIAKSLLDDDMEIEAAGKSAVIRLNSDPIDFRAAASAQMAVIDDNLQKAERLRKFYVQHESLLRQVLFP